MKKYGVYGIGNAIMDLQLQVTEEQFGKLGLTKGAFQLVETAQQERILSHFHHSKIHQASGGSAANTMIAISQLGGKTAYGCHVGLDDFGHSYVNEMKILGVDLHCLPDSGEKTGSCVILITPDAERTMNTHLGASAQFTDIHVSEEHLRQAEWLYIEGYLFSSTNGQAAVKRAVTLAKKHQVKIALTISDAFIVSAFREPLQSCIHEADLIFANIKEAESLVGEGTEEEIFSKYRKLVPHAIMTMSARGAWLSSEGEVFHVPAVKTHAIDETGAGDMFAGAFLYGITHNLSAKRSAEVACLLASKVVSQLGPRLGGEVRELPELKKFFN